MSLTSDVIRSSCWGFVFGTGVHLLTYPLEAIKLLQQDPTCDQRCYQVARNLWQKEGIHGLYKGFLPKLGEVGQKQIWCWPLITQLPLFFERHGFSKVQQQALSGLTIATIDAFLGTPLDYLKLKAVYDQKVKRFSWPGFASNWAKRTMGWSTFLVAQKIFADKQKKSAEEKLSLGQSLFVAMHTATIVSLAVAPLDVINTLCQTGLKLNLKNCGTSLLLRRLYRGWPVGYTGLLIHNLSSILLIDRLTPKGSNDE